MKNIKSANRKSPGFRVKDLKSNGLRYKQKLMGNPAGVDVIIYLILLLATVVTILPIWMVVVRSISPSGVISRFPFLVIPRGFTDEAYRYIFGTRRLLNSFGISVFITVVGTFLNLLFTLSAGYSISKTDVPGVRICMLIIVITMLFGAGLIPTYILMRWLGLLDSIWVLIIPLLVNPFNLILMRNFVWNIPKELEESAKMDGANDIVILSRIILPLSKPVIATLGLFYGLGHWNNFFSALFFITDTKKWPLQLVLRSIVIENNMTGMGAMERMLVRDRIISNENVQAATIIFATIPILMVYPFLQKYFTKGIMMGAIKG